jgi:hypothetical protein
MDLPSLALVLDHTVFEVELVGGCILGFLDHHREDRFVDFPVEQAVVAQMSVSHEEMRCRLDDVPVG